MHLLSLAIRPAHVQRRTINGRQHLIFDAVALVGDLVVQPLGSEGPEYVPPEVLAASAREWDGKPVVGDHPMQGARPVSATTVPQEIIGRVRNPRFQGGRLLAEVHLDVNRARLSAPQLVRDLEAGEMVEVSVGGWVHLDRRQGIANGRRFGAIWKSIEPDHLAVGIPAGACSVADGCGAPRAACRTNQPQPKEKTMKHHELPDTYGLNIPELVAAEEPKPPRKVTKEDRQAALNPPADPWDLEGLANAGGAR